ncbi:Crp/Fnr family transcriptional regulator [Paenibacillus aquistagni]|uniref:cAMP-binding domain of CRP or a regulatory subunit of cAMP-dependent protein kinases n=1 Tax=Paenibacillus aquistagni TaxID=1852522 RepID=A0A1X7LAS8_9BACL|nr:Crp/Fnr family transcriptional regulator [Paenibacillus aquistagni]SMG50968.1 cAMP-binding domain of CRP or a regulatory subunit of cAMP-dependent protein kinases [Paenibacillus aquistagni]
MKDILLKYLDQYTSLHEQQKQEILDELQIAAYKKGTVLLRQGEIPAKCYFVLQGCVRQYSIHPDGKEATSQFYTEEQAIAIFHSHKQDKASEYTIQCLEDSVLVVGDLALEMDMYKKHDQLALMTRKMIEERFGQMQAEYAAFIASTPEERFKSLLHKQPRLIERVPQHQLASYLGMTPESLSRIKKRVQQESGK